MKKDMNRVVILWECDNPECDNKEAYGVVTETRTRYECPYCGRLVGHVGFIRAEPFNGKIIVSPNKYKIDVHQGYLAGVKNILETAKEVCEAMEDKIRELEAQP